VAKKKATGMSKRLGFTDRATIAENKDILRYNDRLEREAKGLPPEAPRAPREARRPRTGGPGRGDHVERAGAGGRPATGRTGPAGQAAAGRPSAAGQTGIGRPGAAATTRPPRTPRPVRPPALDEEQTASLQAALAAAVGETGLEAAGAKVIARLVAHDSFDRATNAGWEMVAAGGNAAERTEPEWALLRKTWLTIRIALLAAYAQIKPELAAAVERERKQLARIERPRRSTRRHKTDRPAGEAGEGTRSGAAKSPRSRRKSLAPTPADVARVAGHAEPALPALPAPEQAPLAQPGPEPEPAPEPAEPTFAAEPEPPAPEPDSPEGEQVLPVDSADSAEIAAELRAEHRGLEHPPPAEEPENADQLTLGF